MLNISNLGLFYVITSFIQIMKFVPRVVENYLWVSSV